VDAKQIAGVAAGLTDEEVDAVLQKVVEKVIENNTPIMMGLQRPDCIIGAPVAVRDDAATRECSECGTMVYLTDGLTIALRWPSVPIVCFECAIEDLPK
jgi:hypothetical protein